MQGFRGLKGAEFFFVTVFKQHALSELCFAASCSVDTLLLTAPGQLGLKHLGPEPQIAQRYRGLFFFYTSIRVSEQMSGSDLFLVS